ncbi:aspartate/glutamate racemase family protein [Longitalea arenae]|uniref:aspartate/glutamate racemase family protein n=1 Tax=Longitalea arenae TaxID=2812558 RepID=UPI001967EB9D|nr:amino acid racemase [Longitalea arenae]
MKKIGIIGGMGPYAGIELMRLIINNTIASTDQEHLPVVNISMPGYIADRSAFLTGKTTVNPGLSISNLILDLEKLGVEIIGIPCNTSHAETIFSVIQEQLNKAGSKVLLLNMISETVNYMSLNYANVQKIGIMCTNGSYLSNIYQQQLQGKGFEVEMPEYYFQDTVIHRAIYDPVFGIKAVSDPVSAEVKDLLNKALSYFRSRNVHTVLLGCTELSVAFNTMETDEIQCIDPMHILAQSLILAAAPAKLKHNITGLKYSRMANEPHRLSIN